MIKNLSCRLVMNERLTLRIFLAIFSALWLFGCAKNPDAAELNEKYETHAKQANEALASKDYDKAVTEYSKAIEAKPETDAYKHRAAAYEARGEHEKAINDYYAVLD